MFSFTCGVNGIDYTTLLAAVKISQISGSTAFFRLNDRAIDRSDTDIPVCSEDQVRRPKP
jgi:hypothetical protein